MRSIKPIILFIFITISVSAHAKEGGKILQVFDQFVASSAAASKCIKPETEVLAHFLTNFQTVSIYASQELAKQYPQSSKENIQLAMKKKHGIISQKVFSIISEKGCDNSQVQGILKTFNMQAQWRPFKKKTSHE